MINLLNGDCLIEMANIPDGSVDLILTDPPYGTINGMGKTGVAKEKGYSCAEWDAPIPHNEMLEQCNRILRMNGCLALFSQDPYTAKLTLDTHGNLPFSYRLTWIKDHFSNCLGCNKSPVNYVEDVCVFFKKYDTSAGHPLRDYARRILNHSGKNLKGVNADLGHRRAEHFLYVGSTQFGLCTAETYAEITEAYCLKGEPWYMDYSELVEIHSRFKRRFKRRFNLPHGSKVKPNVLNFKKDRRGEHPTQKPVALMEDLIKTYTNPGETVLDFTMGSGTTGVAAVNTCRKFIGIELDEKYFDISRERINTAIAERMFS